MTPGERVPDRDTRLQQARDAGWRLLNRRDRTVMEMRRGLADKRVDRERYIEAVERGASTEAAGESLDDETRRMEGLQLTLRTTDGVPVEALDVEGLDGLVKAAGDRWVLTRSGRLLANEISTRLR